MKVLYLGFSIAMLFEFGFRSSLLLIFFVHLAVYSFLFLKRGVVLVTLSDRLLGWFLFCSALFILPWMTGFGGWYDNQPYRDVLFYTPFINALFFGPLLYLYIKSLTNVNYRLKKADLLHFVPGMLYLLWRLVMVVVDKLVLKHYYLMNGRVDSSFSAWYSFAWLPSLLAYLGFSIRYYLQYRKFTYFELSFADAAGLKWLRNFLYASALITLLEFSKFLLSLFFDLQYGEVWYYFFGFALVVYYIAISGYSPLGFSSHKLNFAPPLLLAYERPLYLPQAAETTEEVEWMAGWADKVKSAMEADHLYRNPDLTLTALAEVLGTNPSLLSKVINQQFKLNFNDYVNRYRVEEVKRLMVDEKYQQFNLLAIAYDAGFNSKSTFNRAFKKVTGLNPKDFL